MRFSNDFVCVCVLENSIPNGNMYTIQQSIIIIGSREIWQKKKRITATTADCAAYIRIKNYSFQQHMSWFAHVPNVIQPMCIPLFVLRLHNECTLFLAECFDKTYTHQRIHICAHREPRKHMQAHWTFGSLILFHFIFFAFWFSKLKIFLCMCINSSTVRRTQQIHWNGKNSFNINRDLSETVSIQLCCVKIYIFEATHWDFREKIAERINFILNFMLKTKEREKTFQTLKCTDIHSNQAKSR